ncbi:L-threonine 3-dehydrogenase [Streptomyces violaceorubidus]
MPGHEFAGAVVGVGAQVTEVAVGDQVAVDPSLYCYECRYCRTGHNNLCERWAAIGVTTAGGAAPYAVRPVANCVKLPEHVRTQDAALIEPLSCAVRGYDVLQSRLGAHVLIYGSGTMGLMMLELAKRTGAASVDMVDLNPARLETARGLGVSASAATPDELDRPPGLGPGHRRHRQRGGDPGRPGPGRQGRHLPPVRRRRLRDARTDQPSSIYNQEITITGSMAVLHSYERAADCARTASSTRTSSSATASNWPATPRHWSSSRRAWPQDRGRAVALPADVRPLQPVRRLRTARSGPKAGAWGRQPPGTGRGRGAAGQNPEAAAPTAPFDPRMPEPHGFAYTATSTGTVHITHHNRPATTLNGSRAARFLEEVAAGNPSWSWPAGRATTNAATDGPRPPPQPPPRPPLTRRAPAANPIGRRVRNDCGQTPSLVHPA